jgi:peptidoglycan-associated lipoprotein
MSRDRFRKLALVFGFIALAVFAGGCKKKMAATPPAPPPAPAPAPPPAKPTVTMNASPASIKTGETARLSWSSTNATDLDIEPGVGKVAPEGATPVNPTESTDYTITATGPGGSATASARVEVAAAAPPPAPQPNLNQLFEQNVKDVYFDFDRSDIREDARAVLTKDAEFLRSYPQVRASLEGNCDERGSTEYNLGLGQRRAEAAKKYLVSLGIPAERMESVSWGKEHPVCTEHSEECWQKNRRAHPAIVH